MSDDDVTWEDYVRDLERERRHVIPERNHQDESPGEVDWTRPDTRKGPFRLRAATREMQAFEQRRRENDAST